MPLAQPVAQRGGESMSAERHRNENPTEGPVQNAVPSSAACGDRRWTAHPTAGAVRDPETSPEGTLDLPPVFRREMIERVGARVLVPAGYGPGAPPRMTSVDEERALGGETGPLGRSAGEGPPGVVLTPGGAWPASADRSGSPPIGRAPVQRARSARKPPWPRGAWQSVRSRQGERASGSSIQSSSKAGRSASGEPMDQRIGSSEPAMTGAAPRLLRRVASASPCAHEANGGRDGRARLGISAGSGPPRRPSRTGPAGRSPHAP